MNGTKINQRYIVMGLHENSMASATETAKKIVVNAIYYILGMDIPTGIISVDANANANDNLNHNMLGQQVDGSYKGIVIKNGKKIMR